MKQQKRELSPASLRRKLKTKFIGRNILYYPVISSTIDAAREAVKQGAEEGTIVIADHQTAGRGRFGRQWWAPPDSSILLSIILHPKLEELPRLSMAATLAVAQSIEKVTGLKPLIKWPNDVLIEGKKVSGILIESKVRDDTVELALVGIGINVKKPVGAAPSALLERAAWLSDAGAELPDKRGLLDETLQQFARRYERVGGHLDTGLLHDYDKKHVLHLRRLRIIANKEVIVGRCLGVTYLGQLRLRLDDGSSFHVTEGEICSWS